MKKMLILSVFIGIYIILGNIGEKEQIIPNEAIRMRVIPNSNGVNDQAIKEKVSEDLKYKIASILENTKGVGDAREIIEKNLTEIDKSIKTLLKKENYKLGYNINFGYNYFPEKEFKGIIYDEGMYESVVVTIGEGKGDNWWCVLFPPFCLIEAEESTDIEYKWYIKELIDKYL